jgi:hypothetical protein
VLAIVLVWFDFGFGFVLGSALTLQTSSHTVENLVNNLVKKNIDRDRHDRYIIKLMRRDWNFGIPRRIHL